VVILAGDIYMLFRRFIFGMLIRVAQNPAVQKKAGKIIGKAVKRARPSLLRASRRAGELSRKAKQEMFGEQNQR